MFRFYIKLWVSVFRFLLKRIETNRNKHQSFYRSMWGLWMCPFNNKRCTPAWKYLFYSSLCCLLIYLFFSRRCCFWKYLFCSSLHCSWTKALYVSVLQQPETEKNTASFGVFLWSTLQKTHTEYSKQIFPEKELRGHIPNFHIHVSVSDLYISTIKLPIMLQEICGQILGIYKSLTNTWMWKLGLRPRNPKKRNNKWDFHCSAELDCTRYRHRSRPLESLCPDIRLSATLQTQTGIKSTLKSVFSPLG